MTDLESQARAIVGDLGMGGRILPTGEKITILPMDKLISAITAALQQARRDALVEAREEIAASFYEDSWDALAILDRRIAAAAGDAEPQ